MSRIYEFKQKIDKDPHSGFVSFASMMGGDQRDTGPAADPLRELEEKKAALQKEIDAMLAAAEAEKKRIEQEARDRGMAQGLEEGRQAGRREYEEKMAEALGLIDEVGRERQQVQRRYEEDLLVLIRTMVERLVGHEVSVNPLVIKNCLQGAMQFVVENSMVKVHLHAEDFQRLREMSLEDPSLLQGAKRVELIEDGAISQGGCLLETEFGEIDATLETCRDRLFELVDRAFLAALAANPEMER